MYCRATLRVLLLLWTRVSLEPSLWAERPRWELAFRPSEAPPSVDLLALDQPLALAPPPDDLCPLDHWAEEPGTALAELMVAKGPGLTPSLRPGPMTEETMVGLLEQLQLLNVAESALGSSAPAASAGNGSVARVGRAARARRPSDYVLDHCRRGTSLPYQLGLCGERPDQARASEAEFQVFIGFGSTARYYYTLNAANKTRPGSYCSAFCGHYARCKGFDFHRDSGECRLSAVGLGELGTSLHLQPRTDHFHKLPRPYFVHQSFLPF